MLFRVVAAVVHLRNTGMAGVDDAGAVARAVELLLQARPEADGIADMPVLGSYALGAAELAAYRDDLGSARELWALGMRLGANVTLLFQLGSARGWPRRSATPTAGTRTLERWRERPSPDAAARIRELTATLL